ncbi:hypothetical protein Dimus_039181 [Dionaea muscipula]
MPAMAAAGHYRLTACTIAGHHHQSPAPSPTTCTIADHCHNRPPPSSTSIFVAMGDSSGNNSNASGSDSGNNSQWQRQQLQQPPMVASMVAATTPAARRDDGDGGRPWRWCSTAWRPWQQEAVEVHGWRRQWTAMIAAGKMMVVDDGKMAMVVRFEGRR